MARSIQIVFDDKHDIHRVRNFAEELSRSLDEKAGYGQLPMADADRATTRIQVQNVPARKMSRALAFVETLLKKHYFEDGVNVLSCETARTD